jgi:hypothetical protein
MFDSSTRTPRSCRLFMARPAVASPANAGAAVRWVGARIGGAFVEVSTRP